MTIIKILANADGLHLVQSQSHRTTNWLGAEYAAVPDSLVGNINGGYCNIALNDAGDTVTAVTATSVPDAVLAVDVRQLRDQLLTQTDWTQMPDSPLTVDSKAAFAVYRQSLRDVTAQAGFPTHVVWPEMPSAVNTVE